VQQFVQRLPFLIKQKKRNGIAATTLKVNAANAAMLEAEKKRNEKKLGRRRYFPT
jgi:hypothetical protein